MAFVLTWVHHVIFSLIVIVASLGNSLVIYVLISRRRTFLNKPYTVFILNLAIADFLTAMLLIISRFIYLPEPPSYDVTAAEIFCQIIWSSKLAFNMGYISIFTCVALTVERWIAVVRPTTYRSMKPKHAVYALVIVWLWGNLVSCTTHLRIKYLPEENRCTWAPLPFASKEFPWISLTLQAIMPYTAMIILYCHICYKIKYLPQVGSSQDGQLKRVTIVALGACSGLIVCWFPGRVTFMLSKYGYLDSNGVLHMSFVMLTFCNSCVNPFLYGIFSPRFRAEYRSLFRKTFQRSKVDTISTAGIVDVSALSLNQSPIEPDTPAPRRLYQDSEV